MNCLPVQSETTIFCVCWHIVRFECEPRHLPGAFLVELQHIHHMHHGSCFRLYRIIINSIEVILKILQKRFVVEIKAQVEENDGHGDEQKTVTGTGLQY